MSAKKDLSIEEILAACRSMDGGGGGAAATPEAAAPTESTAQPEAAAPAAATPKPAAGGAKPSQSMSVAEMLAAARGEGGGAAPAASAAAEPAAAAPAASSGKKPSKSMSVAEMMAAARGETGGGAKAAAKPAGGAKKAAAPAAKAATTKKANPKAGGGATGPRDTSSILAAARKSDGERRGPMSRAEAAGKGKGAKAKAVAPPMPEKPSYAKSKPTAKAGDEDRRGFLSVLFGSFLALGFSCLGVVGGLWGLGLARFLFPNILTEPPMQFPVGPPSAFPPGAVNASFKAKFGVWIVNSEYEGQQQITALMSVCTHLGCTPNWLEGEQKFKCPCHGSGFYKDGINFEGPAPRPLERYAIKLSDAGDLVVDKSKTFQQEMGDWKDTACYYPV